MNSNNGADVTDHLSLTDEDDECLRHCMEMMTLATSDSDKLAALLLIPTLLKNKSDYDSSFWISLSRCISPEFLRRMLGTNENGMDETALVVLARLLSNDATIAKMIYSSLTQDVINLFLRIGDKAEISISFLEDLLYSILQLIKHQVNSENIEYIVKHENFFKSIDICLARCPKTIVKFLFDLFASLEKNDFGSEIFFHQLMQSVVHRIEIDKTNVHFEILSQISENLTRIPLWNFKYNTDSSHGWTKSIRIILRGIFQSRLGENERRTGFNVAAALLHCYDISWIREDEDFLQILVNLSCIELRLSIDFSMSEPVDEQSVKIISSSCSILESALRLLTAGCEQDEVEDYHQNVINSQKILQMMDCVLDLIRFLLQFLNESTEISNFFHNVPNEIAFSIHKLLSRFLEDGSELIDEQLLLNSRESFSVLEDFCEKTALEFEKDKHIN